MRKPIRLALIATLFLSPLFGKNRSFPEIRRVVALTELDSPFIDELAVGKYPDVVIECKQGTELPVSLLHNYGHLSLKCIPNLTVKIEEPFYIRCLRKKTYISRDLITWEKAGKAFRGHNSIKARIDAQSGIQIESKTVPWETFDDHDNELPR